MTFSATLRNVGKDDWSPNTVLQMASGLKAKNEIKTPVGRVKVGDTKEI